MPILGLNASKQMKLVEVKDENFEQIFTVYESKNFNNELGCLAGECKLKINENVKPVIMPSKRIPIALRPILKSELDRLENKQVIAKIEEPTEWVSQVVLTKKKNGKARLCIDPRELNKALLREHYTLPIMDDILHELGESKFFSKADLANGYWHIKLDEESSKLTTFQTYYGRYRWKRLPFGLSVSSEIFQRKLTEALVGLSGIICIADDIIIHGKSESEHDLNMKKFIERCVENASQSGPDYFHGSYNQ